MCRDCTHRHQKHGGEVGWDTGSGYYYDIPNDRDGHEDNYMDAAIASAPRDVGYYERNEKAPIQTGEVTRGVPIEPHPSVLTIEGK